MASVDDLLDRADQARSAGHGAEAARLYDEAAALSRAGDELDGWTRALLGAASVYLFGAEPGKLPAQLYDVLARTTDDARRAQLCAALARCWAYAGQPARSARFADESVQHALAAGPPELVADCLDAALASHWGPDELDVRRRLAARLDDTAAHVLDPDVRLQAHLWGLQIACETLDLQAMHRQIRALELLGEESPRALFFAASRRLMLDLMRGCTDTADDLCAVAARAAERAGLADAWLVLAAMPAYTAAQSGDTETCAAGAAECEKIALDEGITVLCAEAAFLWTCASRTDRAGALVDTFNGSNVLDDLPRDVNWLLTLQCVLEAALAVGDRNVIDRAATLLAPYDDRAVINAGAVMFHGVTDDTLARAAAIRGDDETARRLRERALSTYDRIGASWWRDRLAQWSPPAAPDTNSVHLHPIPGELWRIGRSAVPVRGLRGFGYLRELVRHPGQLIAALDLVGAGTGVIAESGLGEAIDKRALLAYRNRLRDIDEQIEEAGEWSDVGRLDALHAERDALLDELRRATGLGGRARTAGSSNERARVAVQKSITAAIARIATVDEPVAAHLRASITTGLSCRYTPDTEHAFDWILD